MGAEVQKGPEPETQDSALEQASKDLKKYEVKEGDTKPQIQAKLVKLQTDRDKLQTAYDEAEMEKRFKDTTKLFATMTQVDEQMKALETAQLTAPYEAPTASKAKMEKGEERLKTKADLEADLRKQTAIIDSADPAVTPQQKMAAQEARAEDQEAIQKLEKKEKRDHAMEEVRKYKEEADRVHATEEQEADAKLETDLKAGEVTPVEKPAGENANAPRVGNEQGKSFEKRVDGFKLGLAQQIANNPPKRGWEKMSTQLKYFMLTASMMLTGDGAHSWIAGDATHPGLTALEMHNLEKIVGMQITPDGMTSGEHPEPKFKITQVTPAPEYAFDSGAADVFTSSDYFGSDGLNVLDKVSQISNGDNGKISIGELRDNYLPAHPDPMNEKLLQMISALTDNGAADTDVFLDAVSKKGYLLVKKEGPAAERPENNESSLDAADVDAFVTIIQGQHFTAETPLRDLSLAYIAQKTTVPLDADALRAPEAQANYAKAVMEKAPQTVAEVIRATGMIPTLENSEILKKDPKEWSSEDKTAIEKALVESLNAAIGPKGDATLGQAIAVMETDEDAEAKAAAAKLKAALSTPESDAEAAPNTPSTSTN